MLLSCNIFAFLLDKVIDRADDLIFHLEIDFELFQSSLEEGDFVTFVSHTILRALLGLE